jgi:hypothetical protein
LPADRVGDPEIKIQLLFGGEKMVDEALKLQAVFLAARPQKTSARTF